MNIIKYHILGGFFMFFVYNKDRIISVIIALSTVLVLFLLANFIGKKNLENTLETSTKNYLVKNIINNTLVDKVNK